jgi:hypothetical protein
VSKLAFDVGGAAGEWFAVAGAEMGLPGAGDVGFMLGAWEQEIGSGSVLPA